MPGGVLERGHDVGHGLLPAVGAQRRVGPDRESRVVGVGDEDDVGMQFVDDVDGAVLAFRAVVDHVRVLVLDQGLHEGAPERAVALHPPPVLCREDAVHRLHVRHGGRVPHEDRGVLGLGVAPRAGRLVVGHDPSARLDVRCGVPRRDRLVHRGRQLGPLLGRQRLDDLGLEGVGEGPGLDLGRLDLGDRRRRGAVRRRGSRRPTAASTGTGRRPRRRLRRSWPTSTASARAGSAPTAVGAAAASAACGARAACRSASSSGGSGPRPGGTRTRRRARSRR